MAGVDPFYGIEVIGYAPDLSSVLLRIEKAAAFRLAEGCSPQFEPLFTRLGNLLRERMITLTQAEPPPSADEQRAKIPRQLKPYLKYTEEQMSDAWAKSRLRSDRHYCGVGYARMYFDRAALAEMYRRPPHLQLVYASILKCIDGASGNGVSRLRQPWEPVTEVVLDEPASTRLKPYRRFEEARMLKALAVLEIPIKQIRVSYGLLAATFHRSTFFRLGKRSRYAKPAIAFLLKRFDELLETAPE